MIYLNVKMTIFRVMQGWLFQSGFWTPPRAKALLTSVPTVRHKSYYNSSKKHFLGINLLPLLKYDYLLMEGT